MTTIYWTSKYKKPIIILGHVFVYIEPNNKEDVNDSFDVKI